MKTTAAILSGLAGFFLVAPRADPPVPPSPVESHIRAVTPSQMQAQQASKPTPPARLRKKIHAGGLLADMARSTNWVHTFSLRTPLSQDSGAENLVYYPHSERVVGIRLFSLKW